MATVKTGAFTLKSSPGLNFGSGAMKMLTELEVLVGVPEEETERGGVNPEGVTNASLAYIHDNGAPEVRIPARPFMLPGMHDAREPVTMQLSRAAQAAIRGNVIGVEQGFHGAGLAAQRAIKNKIIDGIPPPLSTRTLKAREAKGREGARVALNRRAQGYEEILELALPLIDTHEMLNSITYVIRERKKRR